MRRHVIIGNGPAGVVAAETLRKNAPAGDAIVLIGDEDTPPYSRMAIPYLLHGDITERGTWLRKDPQHWKALDIALRRDRVKALDTAHKSLSFESGDALSFDTLLIATGSSPVLPPIPGIHAQRVHTCWTLEDARAIEKFAVPGARVIQLGAGFIGCIIMESLVRRRVALTVVEMGDRMVPRMMGETAGGMIRDWVQAKGVQVHTGARIESIESNPPDMQAPLAVRLSSGQRLAADLVISAAGVKPNIAFLESSAVRCLQGVLTDETMQTSVAGVYAAGDCAEAFDAVYGKPIVSAIQPNAVDQAYVAALNMVGKHVQLRGVTQINVLDTLGLISCSFGQWQGVPGGQGIELTDRAGFKHLSLQFDDDVMVGSNSIGTTEHIGVLRGLVEGRVKLGAWKDKLLADPTALMEAYLATAQAQSRRSLLAA
ncbi:MAG: NAD(P)/FAD-dependent oxidoreductase [Proteobacteria bacterium]|nr:NAD(P)/FAD-dependent oxidoreductase [Pseudomonadota bacterium]